MPHLPIEQNRVWHGGLAGIEGGVGLAAVELEAWEDMPGDFSDDVGIIDHEAGLHGGQPGSLASTACRKFDRGAAAVRANLKARGRDRSTARATLGKGLAVSAFPLYVPV
jgi:hypothetical protein